MGRKFWQSWADYTACIPLSELRESDTIIDRYGNERPYQHPNTLTDVATDGRHVTIVRRKA